MEGAKGDVAAIARYDGNLYLKIFIEVCEVDVANFVHSCAGYGGALALSTWSIECDEHLYTLKHGNKHKPRQNFSSHYYIGLRSVHGR